MDSENWICTRPLRDSVRPKKKIIYSFTVRTVDECICHRIRSCRASLKLFLLPVTLIRSCYSPLLGRKIVTRCKNKLLVEFDNLSVVIPLTFGKLGQFRIWVMNTWENAHNFDEKGKTSCPWCNFKCKFKTKFFFNWVWMHSVDLILLFQCSDYFLFLRVLWSQKLPSPGSGICILGLSASFDSFRSC